MRSSRANSRCPAVSACFRSQRIRRVHTLCSLVTLVTLVKALILPLTPRAGMVFSWADVTASVQLLCASLAAVCRVTVTGGLPVQVFLAAQAQELSESDGVGFPRRLPSVAV